MITLIQEVFATPRHKKTKNPVLKLAGEIAARRITPTTLIAVGREKTASKKQIKKSRVLFGALGAGTVACITQAGSPNDPIQVESVEDQMPDIVARALKERDQFAWTIPGPSEPVEVLGRQPGSRKKRTEQAQPRQSRPTKTKANKKR